MKIFNIDKLYDIFYHPDLVKIKALGKKISEYAKKIDLAGLVKERSSKEDRV